MLHNMLAAIRQPLVGKHLDETVCFSLQRGCKRTLPPSLAISVSGSETKASKLLCGKPASIRRPIDSVVGAWPDGGQANGDALGVRLGRGAGNNEAEQTIHD
jgi:hypothetical protein